MLFFPFRCSPVAIHEIRHPLIRHKLGLLRRADISTKNFRELAQEVTTILMNEEREVLHNWEVQQIYVKQKEETISQYVTETIITLRWYLVNNIIDDLKNSISTDEDSDNSETLEMVMAYLGLTHIFSKNLGRVLSRYN